MIGSNIIEFRRVRRRQQEPEGISWIESWQLRVKSLVGTPPLLSDFGPWQDIDSDGFVYVDEAGNLI